MLCPSQVEHHLVVSEAEKRDIAGRQRVGDRRRDGRAKALGPRRCPIRRGLRPRGGNRVASSAAHGGRSRARSRSRSRCADAAPDSSTSPRSTSATCSTGIVRSAFKPAPRWRWPSSASSPNNAATTSPHSGCSTRDMRSPATVVIPAPSRSRWKAWPARGPSPVIMRKRPVCSARRHACGNRWADRYRQVSAPTWTASATGSNKLWASGVRIGIPMRRGRGARRSRRLTSWGTRTRT
jgi:hypothetical protein